MRAVVDTNILVRALIMPLGTVGPVLQHLRSGDYTLLYSRLLLDELVDVLNRPRIGRKYGLDQDDI
jgi:predicted nucleic acid-binding protein